MFTLDQKIACLEREIAMRKSVYWRKVSRGQMTREEAEHEVAVMRAILDDYKHQQVDLFSGGSK